MKKNCVVCGKPFITNIKKNVCSDECAKERARQYSKRRYVSNIKSTIKVCEECGREYIHGYKNRHKRFCCDSCKEKAKRRMERLTEKVQQKRREYNRVYRSRIRKNTIEKVAYDEIYKRDQGICQICGLPVHFEKEIDNNWDGTIDHIIPVSLGGTTCMNNCQLAHRICNSLKLQNDSKYRIDWNLKSKENNYYSKKFDSYKRLMQIG